MRPSELKRCIPAPPVRKLNFPVDEDADPPISTEEALAAGSALCIRHGGLIGQRGDKEGMVFLCTDCGKYWRYVKAAHHFRRKLRYPTIGYA
jgi:hypothetical protein